MDGMTNMKIGQNWPKWLKWIILMYMAAKMGHGACGYCMNSAALFQTTAQPTECIAKKI